ncbi:dehydrogenase [Roseomonas terrae]|uniref:Dehydrogenase n=1 Tax=Neoroseomonas terrae TaxID=424799 RepID=A0ABS5EG19_9PROT|nr:GHMP kinase [Neoroseomonas terrae]MBR0649978.1 dehydrogenase [Neoroseomonas terrae]
MNTSVSERGRRVSAGASVRARAPLRLGLAGGGTDVSPYAELYGGAVMNATIDRYIYASVAIAEDGEMHFESHDLGYAETVPATTLLPLDGPLGLHRATCNRVIADYCGARPIPLSIKTFSEAPPGSGLGSSSTLVVAMVQALAELLHLPLGEYDVARLAYMIEREDLGLAGGRQDQFAATFGGFNFMEFRGHDDVIVNPLRIRRDIINELESRTILCFTGVSRDSASIIAEQASNVQHGESKPIEAMHRLKDAAIEMKDALLKGDLDGVTRTLSQGWLNKRDMAGSISNAGIERALETALLHGASAGKVSGAGGGGFIMFLVPLDRRRAVWDGLNAAGFRPETVRYTAEGATAWRV